MDIAIENMYRQSKDKDLKVMKVVHDLKTPILSIKQIINTNEIIKFIHFHTNNNENQDDSNHYSLNNESIP